MSIRKNNLQKANKIVTKATTVFGDAVAQVEKANTLLITQLKTFVPVQ